MSEEQNELDAFFTSSNNTPQPEEKEISSSALEDEFSKLLNSFIEESNSSTAFTNKNLDDFLGSTEEQKDTSPSSLDSFVTTSAINSIDDDRINNLFENTEDVGAPIQLTEEQANLKPEELELARAVANFQDGIYALAEKKNLKVPTTDYSDSQLNPNYKPSVGKNMR